MKLAWVVVMVVTVAACGDDDSKPKDAPADDNGGDAPVDALTSCILQKGMSYPTGSAPSAVAIGLFDADTHRDALVLSATELALFPGVGDGTFGAKTVIATLTTTPPMFGSGSMVTADLTADGIDDVVYAAGTSIAVRINNGNGTFQAPVMISMGGSVKSIVAGRFDAGQTIDIAVLELAGEIDLLRNDAGTLTQVTPLTTVGGSGAGSLAVGEVTGDANLDLITGAIGAQFENMYVYAGAGNLTFAAGSGRGAGPSPQGITVADIDGDGKRDVITANSSATNRASFMKGHGDGGFDNPVAYETGPEPVTVVVADLTGDATPDIVTANYGNSATGNISFLTGAADGTFGAAQNVSWCTAGCETLGLAVGDLDGDTRPDVVAANHAEGTLQVLLSRCP